MAGDFDAVNKNCIKEVCKLYKHVIFVPGNHDFYEDTIDGGLFTWRSVARQIPNLHMLYNEKLVLDGQEFVGSVLWFGRPYSGLFINKKWYLDFSCIQDFEKDVQRHHDEDVNFLTKNVTKDSIVITHFMPSELNQHQRHSDSPINCYYITPMDKMIVDKEPKLWIHGHTHTSHDYIYPNTNTRVICNPAGYPNFMRQGLENVDFRKDLIIEV
jgi:UDP-2,3-diacylglucosamine pyrophosphatase LpxH